MKAWKWIFYITLLIFPFGQLASFNFPLKGFFFRLHLIDVSCLFFVLCWFFLIKKTSPPSFFKPLAVFGVIAGMSLAVKAFSLPFGELIPAFFYLVRLYCWIMFFWAMRDFLKKEKININILLVCEGVAVAVFSLWQYLFLSDTRFLYYSGWDDHLFRAIGTFLDPAFNGLILVLSFIVGLNKLLDKSKNNKTFFVIALILIGTTVGLTFSRMSYLLLLLSLFIVLVTKKKYKLFFLLTSVFLLLVFLLPKPTGEGVDLLRKTSGSAKIINYRQILSISKDNLFLGVGYNALRGEAFRRGFLQVKNWQTSHAGAGADNSFLFVLATTGVFGFFSYLYFWLTIVKKTIRQKEAFFLATNICLLISAFFVNSLFYPWILFWWGICLADFTAGTEA